MIKVDLVVNDDIRAKEVRLISSDGEQLGVMDKEKAQNLAIEKELDLVLISPTANPPVCKIMDYGKYRFEMTKRAKEAKKNQRIIEIKEIRLSATIEEHDINVRVKNAEKFFSEGDKIKVSIRFKGRQMAHTEKGYGVMNDFAKRLEGVGVVESKPKLEGRSMTMMMAPAANK